MTRRVAIINPKEGIPKEVRERWRRIQSENPALESPYFAPEFTEIVAASTDGVELGIVEEAGEPAALFPFERERWGFSGPVGSFLSDYNGIISRGDFRLEPRELLRECGLVAWRFDHVPIAQADFAPFQTEQHRSPVLDLSAGYAAYVEERRSAGTEQIKKNGNLLRRLEREVGPVRFVVHSNERSLLEQLLQWKTVQFRENRWRDLFSIGWVREVVERIHGTQSAQFAGVLSALYAGEQLVAAHFGMRSASVWHYWFPAYDPKYARYSPGVMLLLKMAEASASMGIRTIDLGCGEHSYKWRLMNGAVPTASGSVELMRPTTLVRRLFKPLRDLPCRTRAFLGTTRMGALARRVRARLKS